MSEGLKSDNSENSSEWFSDGGGNIWEGVEFPAFNEGLEETEPAESPFADVSIPFEGQRIAMGQSHIERTAEENEQKPGGVKPWGEIKEVFDDDRYEILGHGTTSSENAESIVAEGLNVGDESGYFARDVDVLANFCPLANNDTERMHNFLNNWEHKNAKQIVLYRIPIKYKSAPGSSVAAYVPFYTGDDRVGVYDKEYAYGWYDAEKDEVHLNPNYHGDLDDEKDVAYLEREKARIDEIVNKTKE